MSLPHGLETCVSACAVRAVLGVYRAFAASGVGSRDLCRSKVVTAARQRVSPRLRACSSDRVLAVQGDLEVAVRRIGAAPR